MTISHKGHKERAKGHKEESETKTTKNNLSD